MNSCFPKKIVLSKQLHKMVCLFIHAGCYKRKQSESIDNICKRNRKIKLERAGERMQLLNSFLRDLMPPRRCRQTPPSSPASITEFVSTTTSFPRHHSFTHFLLLCQLVSHVQPSLPPQAAIDLCCEQYSASC